MVHYLKITQLLVMSVADRVAVCNILYSGFVSPVFKSE
jgi:hypothetical protein